jgi:hypothetical protein
MTSRRSKDRKVQHRAGVILLDRIPVLAPSAGACVSSSTRVKFRRLSRLRHQPRRDRGAHGSLRPNTGSPPRTRSYLVISRSSTRCLEVARTGHEHVDRGCGGHRKITLRHGSLPPRRVAVSMRRCSYSTRVGHIDHAMQPTRSDLGSALEGRGVPPTSRSGRAHPGERRKRQVASSSRTRRSSSSIA